MRSLIRELTILTVLAVVAVAGAAIAGDLAGTDQTSLALSDRQADSESPEEPWQRLHGPPVEQTRHRHSLSVVRSLAQADPPGPRSLETGGDGFGPNVPLDGWRSIRDAVQQPIAPDEQADVPDDPGLPEAPTYEQPVSPPGVEETDGFGLTPIEVDELPITAAELATGSPQEEGEREEHPPIEIESNDGFQKCTCVRAGIGTAEDPYVISGWRIEIDAPEHMTADGYHSAIRIANTDAHFVLRDNHVTESDSSDQTVEAWAFDMENVKNAVIEENLVEGIGNLGEIGQVHYDAARRTLAPLHPVEDLSIVRNVFEDNRYDGLGIIALGDVTITDNLFREVGQPDKGGWDAVKLGNGPAPYEEGPVNDVQFTDNAVLDSSTISLSELSTAVIARNTGTATGLGASGENVHFHDNEWPSLGGSFTDSLIENNVARDDDAVYFTSKGNVTIRHNTLESAGTHLNGEGLMFHNNTVLTIDGIFDFRDRPGGLIAGTTENIEVRDNEVRALTEWDGETQHTAGIDRDGRRAISAGIYTPGAWYAEGGNVFVNNTVEGYDTCIWTGQITGWTPQGEPVRWGIPDQRWENNTLLDCEIAWNLEASPRQTLRNNNATNIELGSKFLVQKTADLYQDIDPSNTVDGKPMLWVQNATNVTLDDPGKPYDLLGVVNSTNVTIADKDLGKGLDRMFLFFNENITIENVTAKDNARERRIEPGLEPARVAQVLYSTNVTVANSTFEGNDWSLDLFVSTSTVQNNTFHGDKINSVSAIGGTPAIRDNSLPSSDPPSWYPEPTVSNTLIRGDVGVLTTATEEGIVENNTVENRQYGIVDFFSTGLAIANNRVLGGSTGIATFDARSGVVIEDNEVEKALWPINPLWSHERTVVANNTVDESRFGITAISSEDLQVEDNAVVGRTWGVGLFQDTEQGSAPIYDVYGNVTGNLVMVDRPEPRLPVGIYTVDRPGDNPTTVANNTIHVGGNGAGIVDDNSDYFNGCDEPGEYRVLANEVRWSMAGISIQCDNMDDTDPAPALIHRNRFVDNEIGLLAFPFEGRINATDNWWGALDGPSYTEGGFNGSGDPIDDENAGTSLDIEVDPWLEQAPTRAVDVPLTADAVNADPSTDEVNLSLDTIPGADAYLAPDTDGITERLGTERDITRDYLAPGDYEPVAGAKTDEGAAIDVAPFTMPGHPPELSPSVATAVIDEPTAIDLGLGTDDGYPVLGNLAYGDGQADDWHLATQASPSSSGASTTGASQSSAPGAVPQPGVAHILTDGPGEDHVDRLEERYGPVETTFSLVDGLRVHVAEEDLDDLRAEPWVEIVSTPRQGEPMLDLVRQELEVDRAWDMGIVGDDVTVAVIDTGINGSHPDLAGHVKAAYDFSNQRCTQDGGAGGDEPCPGTEDASGHGTAMAGIIAGTGKASDSRYIGVAPGAQIVDLRVADEEGRAWETWVIDAVEWIQEHGDEYGIDMVYNGIGFRCVETHPASNGFAEYFCDDPQYWYPLEPMVDNLVDRGTPFVMPAGNDGWAGEDSLAHPGQASGTLTVGAVSDRRTPDAGDDVRPYWSSQGGEKVGVKPAVVAPGVGVTTTSAIGGSYLSGDGTSASGAAVAGLVAQMLDRNPALSPQQIKDTLNATATRPAGMDGAAPNPRYGHGVASAAAVEAIESNSPFTFEHTYTEPGLYPLTATATDSLIDHAKHTVMIPVHGVNPGFEVLNPTPRAMVNTTFADESQALPDADLTYDWTFGDGNSSLDAGPSPNHTYVNPGEYAVTLTVTETGWGTWSTTRTITVEPSHPGLNVLQPEEVDAGIISDTVLADETVRLRVTANPHGGTVANLTLYPEGPDGPSLEATQRTEDLWTAEHTYTTTGQHTVHAVAEDTDGFVSEANRTISVVDNQPPIAEAGSGHTIEIFERITLDASASHDPEERPLSYAWTVTNGTATFNLGGGAEMAWTPPSIGSWTAMVTVTDAHGATDTASTTILVDDLIRAETHLVTLNDDPNTVGMRERPVVMVNVVDHEGHPVAGASLTVAVDAGTGGASTEVQTSTTSTGLAYARIPFDVGQAEHGFNLPGEHTAAIEIETDSRADAPVQDTETLTEQFTYTVTTLG